MAEGAIEFAMPKLGHLMEEGIIVRWMKKVGDWVQKDEILLEVETEKAVVEVESNVSGVLLRILVEEGATVEVGRPLALFGEAGRTENPS